MNARGVVVGMLACLALAGCGESTGNASHGEPLTLPVGPTEWDVSAPAWLHEGTLHVGERTVELGNRADQFVLGPTGVYWMRGETLMFTSAEGDTRKVTGESVGNQAVSPDRSVFATVVRGDPTDQYGTHVLQLVAFDTRTGEQLYRTPDEEPDDDADLGSLYPETMPLLEGLSNERVYFDDSAIDLGDGSTVPPSEDADGIDVYEGYAETLFADGYHVGIREVGGRVKLVESRMHGLGRLSPDRSTIFDLSMWPTEAVVHDATTGRQRPIDAPWEHFVLVGWSDEDTFFGVAEHIENRLLKRQVVTCELPTLACMPVSPVIPVRPTMNGQSPAFLVEGSGSQH